jgi:hypothetical protein
MKISKKRLGVTIVGLALIIVTLLSGYFLLKPKEKAEPQVQLFELKLNYKPGETFVFNENQTMEAVGQKVQTQTRTKLDIMEVQAGEILARFELSSEATTPLGIPQQIQVDGKQLMTDRGELIRWEIEKVEPSQYRKGMRESLNRSLERGALPQMFYPVKALTLGEEWEEEIELEWEEAGRTYNLSGLAENKLASRERIEAQAGEFDCLKLETELNCSGEGRVRGLTTQVRLVGEQLQWIDLESGAPVRSKIWIELETMLGAQSMGGSILTTESELIEYQQA